MKTIKVVASIIVNDTYVLATQRGYGEFKGKWEFPGGKIENGETAKDALVREIKEELDIEVVVDSLFDIVEYDYPNFHLSMECYLCRINHNHFVLKEHLDAKWLNYDTLDSVDWLPADIAVILKLKEYLKTI